MIFTYPLVLPGYVIAFVLVAVVGIPAVAGGASFTTLQQTVAPDAYRGRVLGTISTTFALATLAGMAVAGALGEVTSVILLLGVQAFAYLLVGPGVFEQKLTRGVEAHQGDGPGGALEGGHPVIAWSS